MSGKKEKVYSYVGTILLVGSFCAASLLMLGLGILFFQAHPTDYLTSLVRPYFSDIFSNLFRGEPTAIISLGILVMMLTPFLRVVAATFSFISERDFRYTAIAFGVMLILLLTILPNFV